MVQNFSHLPVETGRANGGLSLLLLGNGDGTFTPVWPKVSGLIVRGDARGLTTTDFNGDGWPDFVVGINDGEVLTFQNGGSIETKVVKVRLTGDSKNPNAVGSRVTAVLSDNSRQTAEIHAGGGYLSQTTHELVFGLARTNQLKRLIVRRPDGRQTMTTNGIGEAIIRLKQPGA